MQPLLQIGGRTGEPERAVDVAREQTARRKLANVRELRPDHGRPALGLHEDLRLRLVPHAGGGGDSRSDPGADQRRDEDGRPPRSAHDYSFWRRTGNRITSRIASLPARTMASRSIPTPRPPVG